MSQPGKVGDGLARALLTRITDEGLAPGTRLPGEAQMLAEYRVGRGTLREALRILEVNGLITIRPGPGGGPVVRETSTADFARAVTMFLQARGVTLGEAMQARQILEPVCADLAAQRGTPEEAARLAAKAPDPAAFHAGVVELGGNGVLGLFAAALTEICRARLDELPHPAGMLEVHQAIARAIGTGAAEQAERLMREHQSELQRWVEKEQPQALDEVIGWMR